MDSMDSMDSEEQRFVGCRTNTHTNKGALRDITKRKELK